MPVVSTRMAVMIVSATVATVVMALPAHPMMLMNAPMDRTTVTTMLLVPIPLVAIHAPVTAATPVMATAVQLLTSTNAKTVNTIARHTPRATIKHGDSAVDATLDTKVMVLHVPPPTHAIQIHVPAAQPVLQVPMVDSVARVLPATAAAVRATAAVAMLMNAILVLTTVPPTLLV
jgi:hypothetical protein